MNFPSVDDLAVLENIVMRMLGGGQAGVIGQDPNPIADLQAFECGSSPASISPCSCERPRDAHSGLAAVQIKHMPVPASRIKPDRAAVF